MQIRFPATVVGVIPHFRHIEVSECLTFKGLCLVIYSYNENQRDSLFLMLLDKVSYMFWTCRTNLAIWLLTLFI